VGAGIFVVHTKEQARDAGALVDLLESALALPDGALACSSLPGYAWSVSGQSNVAEWDAMLQRVGAAVALADSEALSSPQWMFDVAAAHGRGLWTVVLLEDATQASRLPVQLTSATLALRSDETSVRAVVEDLAFELGFAPRLGQETKEAIATFSSIPPDARREVAAQVAGALAGNDFERSYAEPPRVADTYRPPSAAQRNRASASGDDTPIATYESLDTVPPAVSFRGELRSMPSEPPAPFASEEEPLELDADELQPIDSAGVVMVSRAPSASPVMAFDAGRAISECSFHRHSGGDFARELEQPFGGFIDAIGGDWRALQRIEDVEVWLGATDNLLDSLPSGGRVLADWYELGYQLSTLLSIAEHGGFDDFQQRETYEELWGQAMHQLRQSGARLRLSGRDLDAVQWRLENLVGPLGERDYRNVTASLETLGELALAASRDAGIPEQLARYG
jgi:hypothetical protein